MKLKRKLMGFTLAVCMAAGLLPAEVSAAGTDTGKAIQLVEDGSAANISGEQGSNVYYGTYQQSSDGNGGYNTDPIKWRVLSNEEGTQPDEGDKLFLLADQNLDVVQYHVDKEAVTWADSTMRSWFNGYDASYNTGGNSGIDYSADAADSFLGSAFSGTEQGAIAETEVENSTGGETLDQIFLLSLDEVQKTEYGFRADTLSDTARVATNTAYVASSGMYDEGKADMWWLRSPGSNGNLAAVVNASGGVYSNGSFVYNDNIAVRPAFKLNLEFVLFTSAAKSGKIPAASGSGSSGGAVGEIFEIPDYTGKDWKLTMLDSGRNFQVSESEVTGRAGGTIALTYSGATIKTDTAPNEYISVMIADSTGSAVYYGRITQPTEADGTVELTLPDSLAKGEYTLKVFSEQYNGGENDDTKLTDYGSAFSDVALKIDNTAPTLTAGEVTRTSDTSATVKFTSNEAGTYYYEVVEGGALGPTIDTTGTGTACDTSEQIITLDNLTAGAKDIYIAVKDGVGNVSQPLKTGIPAYIPPSHGISASPSALDFGTLTEGYATAPEAQTVIVENTGNQSVTISLPASTSYAITAGAGFEADGTAKLDVSGAAQFMVQPKTGLAAGDYNETITISGTGATQTSTAQASVALSLHVHGVTPVSGKEASCTEEGSKAYYTCTVCGKAFEDQECTKEIADLESWRVIPVKEHTYESGRCTQCNGIDPDFRPSITEGAGGVWKKGSKDTLSFRSDAGYADFLKVQMDGSDVAVTDYEVSEGSTIVTLKSSYLESLSVGVHTLAIVSQTGTAEATFTIQEGEGGGTGQEQETPSDPSENTPQGGDGETSKTEDETTKAESGTSLTGGGDSKAGSDTSNTSGKAPGTGDDSRAALWGMLALFAGICSAEIVLVRRKKIK